MGAVKVISPSSLRRGRARNLFLDRIQSGIYIAVTYDIYIYTFYIAIYICTYICIYVCMCRCGARNEFFSSRISQKTRHPRHRVGGSRSSKPIGSPFNFSPAAASLRRRANCSELMQNRCAAMPRARRDPGICGTENRKSIPRAYVSEGIIIEEGRATPLLGTVNSRVAIRALVNARLVNLFAFLA